MAEMPIVRCAGFYYVFHFMRDENSAVVLHSRKDKIRILWPTTILSSSRETMSCKPPGPTRHSLPRLP